MDWIQIKNEYINTNISYRALAKKYAVSDQTLAHRAKKEHWVELREKQRGKINAKILQKAAEKVANTEVKRLERLLALSDKVTDKLEKALEQLGQVYIEGETVDTGIISTAKLRQIVQSLKDIQEMQKPEEIDADNANIVINISGAEENGS